MAADYSGNPIRMDTNADAIPAGCWVQQITWTNVDGATAIVAEDRLQLTINGTLIEAAVDDPTTGQQAVMASFGPFAQPIYCETLVVTLIEGGQVQVWIAPNPPESVTP